MNIIKNILSVIVIFTMLVTSSSVFALDERYDYENEAEQLVKALGIFDSQSCKGEITRGDFCEIMSDFLNLRENLSVSKNANEFYDVKFGHKNYAAIYTLNDYGIIRDTGYNMFMPDEAITVNDAGYMLAVALGYRFLKYEGNSDVLKEQRKSVISKLMNGMSGKLNATSCIKLLYKALMTPLLIQDSYGNGDGFSTYEDRTPLSEYHKIFRSEGIVGAVYGNTTINGVSCPEGKVYINGKYYDIEDKSFNEFFGIRSIYYYFDNKDENPIIKSMTVSKNTSILEIDGEDISKIEENQIIYFEKDSNKTNKAKIADSYDMFLNGISTMIDDANFLAGCNNVTLIDNDNDKVYDVVFVTKHVNYIVDSVSISDNKLIVKPKYNLRQLELEKEDTQIKLYSTDGSILTEDDFSSIGENTVLSVSASDYENYGNNHLIASNNSSKAAFTVGMSSVNGVITEMQVKNNNRELIYLDGVEFKVALSNYLSEESDIGIGDKVTLFLDCEGKIAGWLLDESTGTKTKYGYLINAMVAETISEELSFKLLTEDNEIIIVSASEKLKLNGAKIDYQECLESLERSAAYINNSYTYKTETTTISRTIGQVIRYKLNSNNEIFELETITASTGVADSYSDKHLFRDYTADKMKIELANNYALTALTGIYTGTLRYWQGDIYFKVPTTDTFEDDDYEVISTKKEYNMESAYKYVEAYDVNVNRVPKVCVLYDDTRYTKIVTTNFPFPVMIKKISRALNEEEEEVDMVTAVTGITEKVYYADNLGIFDGFRPGDLVLLYGKGSIVTNVEYLEFDGTDMSIDNLQNIDVGLNVTDNYYSNVDNTVAFGEVYTASDRYIVMQSGELQPDSEKRAIMSLFYFSSNRNLQHGGAILYDCTTSTKKPDIRVAVPKDIKTVLQNGNAATKALYISYNGSPRQLILYNGID